MAQKQKRKIYANFVLKSLGDYSNDDYNYIEGVASTMSTDREGQIVNVDGINFEQFLKSGYVTVEHHGVSEFSKVIGRPVEVFVRDSKLHVKIKIYKARWAQEVYDFIKELEETENDERQMRFSIEGFSTKFGKNRDIIEEMVMTDLALTLRPANEETYVKIKKSMEEIKKTDEAEKTDVEKAIEVEVDKSEGNDEHEAEVGHADIGVLIKSISSIAKSIEAIAKSNEDVKDTIQKSMEDIKKSYAETGESVIKSFDEIKKSLTPVQKSEEEKETKEEEKKEEQENSVEKSLKDLASKIEMITKSFSGQKSLNGVGYVPMPGEDKAKEAPTRILSPYNMEDRDVMKSLIDKSNIQDKAKSILNLSSMIVDSELEAVITKSGYKIQ